MQTMPDYTINFQYLDLVAFVEDTEQMAFMIEDYTFTSSGTEYTVRSQSGTTRHAAPHQIRKIGRLDWPIPFGSHVIPTTEFESRNGLTFRHSVVAGMSYDYAASIWHFAITLDDGTNIMAERTDFTMVEPPESDALRGDIRSVSGDDTSRFECKTSATDGDRGRPG